MLGGEGGGRFEVTAPGTVGEGLPGVEKEATGTNELLVYGEI